LQVSQRPAARLWTSKAWGKTGMQTEKSLSPTADIGRDCFDPGQGDMLILLQDLLLSASAF
jgi:hypothetical protein